MVKRILVGTILAIFISSCFAGFSSGGRSGFSGGSRSFSASRSYSTVGRSGYSRSTNTTRAYVAPRSYSGTSRSYSGSNTVVHNNHYSSGGWGFGGVNGFFSGFLGGYLGGTMANHGTTVVAGGGVAPVVGSGQGMLMEQPYVQPYHGNNIFGFFMGIIMLLFVLLIFLWASISLYRHLFPRHSYHNSRW